MKRRIFLGALFAPLAAHAHSTRVGQIAIGHAWALPSQLSDGQVFLPLVNNGDLPDSLVAARSEIAATIELRRNNRYDDPAETEFELLPGKPLPMRPTARHLRLIGLKHSLKKSEVFSLILDFKAAGEVEAQVHVESSPVD
jgi:periplasmic copper chaperone A